MSHDSFIYHYYHIGINGAQSPFYVRPLPHSLGSKIPLRRNSFSPMRKNGFSTPKVIENSPKSPVICEGNEGEEGVDVAKSDLMEMLVNEGSTLKVKIASPLTAEQVKCLNMNGEKLPISVSAGAGESSASLSSASSSNSSNSIFESYRPRSKTSILSSSNSTMPCSKYLSDYDQSSERVNGVLVMPSILAAEDEVHVKSKNRQGDVKHQVKFLSHDKPATVAEAIMQAQTNASKYSHLASSVSSQQHVVFKSSVSPPLSTATATAFSSPPTARMPSSSSSTYAAISPILQQQNSVSHYSNSPDISIFSPDQKNKYSSENYSVKKEAANSSLNPSEIASIHFCIETPTKQTDSENGYAGECSVGENDNLLQDFYPNETSFFIGELTDSAKKSIHNGTLEPSPQLVDQFFSVYKEIFNANSGHENIEEIQKSVCSESDMKLIGDENEEEIDPELSMLWETETNDLLSETGEIYEEENEYVQEKKFSVVTFVKIFSVLLFAAFSCVGGCIGLNLLDLESAKVSPYLFQFPEESSAVPPGMLFTAEEPSFSPSSTVELYSELIQSPLSYQEITHPTPVSSDDIEESSVILIETDSEQIVNSETVDEIEISDIAVPVLTEENTDFENDDILSEVAANASTFTDVIVESVDAEKEIQYVDMSDMQVSVLYVTESAQSTAALSELDGDIEDEEEEEVMIVDIASSSYNAEQLSLNEIEAAGQQPDEGEGAALDVLEIQAVDVDVDDLSVPEVEEVQEDVELQEEEIVVKVVETLEEEEKKEVEKIEEEEIIEVMKEESISDIIESIISDPRSDINSESDSEIETEIEMTEITEEQVTQVYDIQPIEVEVPVSVSEDVEGEDVGSESSEEVNDNESEIIELAITVTEVENSNIITEEEEEIVSVVESTIQDHLDSAIVSSVSLELNGEQETVTIVTVEITDISSKITTEKSNKPYSPATLFLASGLISVISCFAILIYTVTGLRKRDVVGKNVLGLGEVLNAQRNIPSFVLAMFSSLKFRNVPCADHSEYAEEQINSPVTDLFETATTAAEIEVEAVEKVEEERIQEIETEKKTKKSSIFVVEKRITRNAAKNLPEPIPEEHSATNQRPTRLRKKL